MILLIFILTGAACVGYYFYNKGPVNIKKASAKKVEAAALYNSFAADSTTAQKNYSGKILIVSGTVAQTTHNQQGRSVILLKTAGSSSFINCTLEQEITSGIKENQVIQIKGICSGLGQADADLGLEPDLYLERCILQ
ncbi:MAG: hypothetical protein H7Y86_05380 [Rhizobacter sp.]|nr:hypothetical protein [Ferruginibacter sp.]